MRIANICLSRSWGGLEMQALRWACHLCERGHSVTSMVLRGSRLSENLLKQGLPQITVPLLSNYFNPGASFKIRSFLKSERIEIVQVHCSRDLWILHPACIGIEAPKTFLINRIHFRKVTKKDPLHTLVFKRLAGVITLTEFARKLFIAQTRISPEKVTVIPNGFRVSDYDVTPETRRSVRNELQIDESAIAIGCVGRIDRLKGQYEAIEAVRSVASRYKNLKLFIVGEPTLSEGEPYLDFLKRKVHEYRIESIVIFLGYREGIPRLLSAFDIFVLPSYEETFGNSLVEAMLSGLACIGTDSGGTPEVLDGGRVGLLVEPRSSGALARAIQTLIENNELRVELGRRARQWARQKFDCNVVFSRIENLYMKALSQQSGAHSR